MWKTIMEFPNYEVSDQGEVRRKKTKRLLTPAELNGYTRVNLRKDNHSYTRYIHRLVADAFLEKPEGVGVEVNHKDGVRSNNNLNNLEWVTHQQNVVHSYLELGREKNQSRVRVEFLVGPVVEFNSMVECAKAFSLDPTTIRDYIQHECSPNRKIQANFFFVP